jgi:ribonucleotide reductase beta subunit family protein with ferritin-like domain
VLHLATDDFYSQWKHDKSLYQHIKFVHECSKSDDELEVTAALCALEGINLFSAFGFFKAFNTRGWNYISHFVSGIDGSAKDENFHSMFSSWLFRQCKYEREQLGNHNHAQEEVLKEKVYKMVRTIYTHELAIIDKLFEFEQLTGSPIRVIKKHELVHFVQDRVDTVLGYLGYDPIFNQEKGEISKFFYLNISSFKMSDFFVNTQLQYKRNWNVSALKFSENFQ